MRIITREDGAVWSIQDETEAYLGITEMLSAKRWK
jgi:hypothetical protein